MARSQQVWASYPQAKLVACLEEGLEGGCLEALERFSALTVEFWAAHGGGLLRAVSRLSGDDHPSLRGFRHQAQDPLIERCAATIREVQELGALSSAITSGACGERGATFS